MIIRRVFETIKQHDMIRPGEHVIVAVSGGADSLALLHILYVLKNRLAIRLSAAHLDHMIRGEASQKDAAFVESCARALKVACRVERRDVAAVRNNSDLTLQEAARKVRYAFFRDMLAEHGGSKCALGHNANDQAETVLMRLLRGTSLQGMGGIPPVREGTFIRPLITTSRKDIERYLHREGIAFLPDTSAGELCYERNRIRHTLLPLLEREYNPRIVEALNRTALQCRKSMAVIDAEAQRAAGRCIVRDGSRITCCVPALQGLDETVRSAVIRHAIEQVKGDLRGITSLHVAAVMRLLESRGSSHSVQIPGGWRICREYDLLVFSGEKGDCSAYCHTFASLPERVVLDGRGSAICFRIEKINDPDTVFLPPDPRTAFINCEQAAAPVTIRTWLPGDRFYPLGLGGSKKIQDFFVDEKVPSWKRKTIPLVFFQDTLAWVGGLRIDERFKVPRTAERALRIWLE